MTPKLTPEQEAFRIFKQYSTVLNEPVAYFLNEKRKYHAIVACAMIEIADIMKVADAETKRYYAAVEKQLMEM